MKISYVIRSSVYVTFVANDLDFFLTYFLYEPPTTSTTMKVGSLHTWKKDVRNAAFFSRYQMTFSYFLYIIFLRIFFMLLPVVVIIVVGKICHRKWLTMRLCCHHSLWCLTFLFFFPQQLFLTSLAGVCFNLYTYIVRYYQ